MEKQYLHFLESETECTGQISGKNEEVLSIQESFDLFVKNTAKSVCCKEKVDNPNIDYYDVIGDKLVCLTEGNSKLNCTMSS